MADRESKPIIEVRDLRAAYGEAVILRDIRFTVQRGEVFTILGGSGCGKSTLMKHMIGLSKPAAGAVLIDGVDITQAEGEQLRDILRRIGVMYQHGALFGSMSLLENVCLVLEECTDLPRPARRWIAQAKLNLVGLADDAWKMPSEISGGMCKRAAIARAMALDPEILFLDEPSAGLDPITSAQMDELILRLSRDLKITFVIVTHELPSIFSVAGNAIILDANEKTIIAAGPPVQLKDHSDNPWVRQFFNRRAEPVTTEHGAMPSGRTTPAGRVGFSPPPMDRCVNAVRHPPAEAHPTDR